MFSDAEGQATVLLALRTLSIKLRLDEAEEHRAPTQENSSSMVILSSFPDACRSRETLCLSYCP